MLVFGALVVAVAPYLSAQQRSLPPQFAAWSGRPSATVAETTDFPNFAALSKEAGLRSSESVEYSSGASKIRVELWNYRDPSSAYEIYSALIRPTMHPSILDQTSAVDGDKLYVLLGNSILKWQPTPAIASADLATLVKIVAARSDKTPLPPIRGYLPRGFIDGSQKYALGPEGFRNALATLERGEFLDLVNQVGFAVGAETMLARYRTGKDDAVLLLIDYPTPQLAEQHLRHAEQALSPEALQAGTSIERQGSLLTLLLRPSSAAYAKSLRSAIHYETEVTWHQPKQTITDPPWTTILGKIIILTMLFMVVAVVLGVAFGGVRVLAKVFFPGRVFDRPQQMEVLQLGLSSKRIDSKDFY